MTRASGGLVAMPSPGFPEPVSIYINWAAYDLLSDAVPLTEELAFGQLDHLLRLKRHGVRMDYYLMDAFWFDPDGGYRTWDRRYWSVAGGERWIRACHDNAVLPGLWVATNALATPIFRHLNPVPAWRDSLTPSGESACMFHGGFMPDFMTALQAWVDRGIGLFKFDFADLDAAPPEIQRTCLPSEIRRRNAEALRTALQLFRERNPDVKLLAYNGLIEAGATPPMAGTSGPIRRSIDTRWLDVFDAVYCGDPRPADVPCANFWRSKDIYSDHMVRYFEANGYPLSRIDNSGFMIGTTGTCYGRRKQAWRGMLVLSLARGGWANTYYGNLDLLADTDARWFAKAQRFFFELQHLARWTTFGAVPGEGEPYGFWAHRDDGDVFTVVNPAPTARTIALPAASERLLFSDAGFEPELAGKELTLGPEQLAMVASGKYATEAFTLGKEQDVSIPQSIERIAAAFEAAGGNKVVANIERPPEGMGLRVIVRQTRGGGALRSSGGPPPDGVTLAKILRIEVRQNARTIPVRVNYDLAIWSGLSWAVGEIAAGEIAPTGLLSIACSTTESAPVQLAAEAYSIS